MIVDSDDEDAAHEHGVDLATWLTKQAAARGERLNIPDREEVANMRKQLQSLNSGELAPDLAVEEVAFQKGKLRKSQMTRPVDSLKAQMLKDAGGGTGGKNKFRVGKVDENGIAIEVSTVEEAVVEVVTNLEDAIEGDDTEILNISLE